MDVMDFNFKDLILKISVILLALLFWFGSTSYSVRAVILISQSESETVDPKEEKQVYQRLNESRLIRRNPHRRIWHIDSIKDQPSGKSGFVTYRSEVRSLRDYHSPILRAPPSIS